MRRVAAFALGLGATLVGAMAQAASQAAPQVAPKTAARGPLWVVALPAAAAWQDLALLAALPVAAAQHGGAPLVLAVPEHGVPTPEQVDFVRRLQPPRLLWLGAAPAELAIAGIPGERLPVDDADHAAADFALRMPPGARAVVVPAADYAAALVGAVVATRCRAPLLFAGAEGLTAAARAVLTARGTRSLLLVGEFGKVRPTLAAATSEALRTPAEAARWLHRHDLPVDYLAAAVPADRGCGQVRKLSLAAAVLAAGRGGAVVPLGTADTPPASADAARAALAGFRKSLGAEPELLSLCAMPELLPSFVVPSGEGIDTDPPSDLRYGDTDADPFVEVAFARFVAEDGHAGLLQAARNLAYEWLLPDGSDSAWAMAEWERAAAPLLQNHGFAAPTLHPGGQPFDATSPLAAARVLVHGSHSSWLELGTTAKHDAKVLLAPCVVESSGCSAAALDQDPEHRSVALRLLRNGAVAFVGNVRRAVGQSEFYRSEFWHALLAGQPLGRAHRHALNRVQALLQARGETERGLHRYQYYNAACYGDPAFVLRVPAAPRVLPARAELRGNEITVHAPAEWWPVAVCVVPDWNYTLGPGITTWRGAGVGVDCSWDGEHRRNRDDLLFTVEVRTKRVVDKVVAVARPPAPLGWDGKWAVDEHRDGSRSVYFAVRLCDFDMDAGVVLRQAKRLQFRLE